MKIRAVAFLAILFFGFAQLADAQIKLDSGLVAYYSFNGTFNDASGKGNNGIAMNGTAFGEDQWGNSNSAAYFDGIDDWINVAAPSFAFGHVFTIAFRYKTNTPVHQSIMAKSDYSGEPLNFQFQVAFNHPTQTLKGLYLGTNHTGTCSFGASGDIGDFGIVSDPIITDAWNSAVIMFENGIKTFYLNGVLRARTVVSTGNRITMTDSCTSGSFRMGTWWEDDPRYFSGLLDEVRLYGRTLNLQEIDSFFKWVSVPSTGVSGLSERAEVFRVHPNPANEQLTIESDQASGSGYVALRNVTGQIVLEQRFSGSKLNISTRDIPAGMYFLELSKRKELSEAESVGAALGVHAKPQRFAKAR